jgi:ubiquinone biosynthesis protein
MRKMRRLLSEVEHLVEALPGSLLEILQQIQSGKFDVHLDHRGLEPSVNRLVLGMLTSSLFLGSALIWGLRVPPLFFGVPILGPAGCTVSIALGFRLLRAINKSGHLD